MSGIRIEGATSGNLVEVDTGNHLKTNLGKDTALAGYAIIMSEVDAGAVTGAPYLLSPEVSEDYRLRVGTDTIVMSETFNYATQDFGKWYHLVSGAGTNTFGTGFINISPIAVTVNIGAMIKTCRTFPIYGASSLYVEWTAAFTQIPGANNIMELGVGIPATAIGALLDGVVFRWNAAGALRGVINYNGTEYTTPDMVSPAVNTTHKYVITFSEREIQFWIDDVLQARLATQSSFGAAAAQANLPTFARCYNNSVAPNYIQVLKVSDCTVSIGDWATTKPWAHQMAGAGLNSIQGASGFTSTSGSAAIVNAAAPAAITLAAAGPGYPYLGGQFSFAAPATAETDYVVFGYQVPAAAVATTGRTLYVTGISIDTWNTVVAVATTPTLMVWMLGVGSTAITLATVDGAGTKATRRVPLGVQFWPTAAVVGQPALQINKTFETPYCVNAGEFLEVILKVPLGTATATEIFRGVCAINGYWE